MQLCEGSTFIGIPNGMKLCHPLKYSKSLASTQIQLISWSYVSTGEILAFCPYFQFVKQVYFILLHYGWKYFHAFSYPYNPPTQEISSFHVSNMFLEFSQVSGQKLWKLAQGARVNGLSSSLVSMGYLTILNTLPNFSSIGHSNKALPLQNFREGRNLHWIMCQILNCGIMILGWN